MPLAPSLNRVILLGWIAKTRIGTNQHGQRYFTFTLATRRLVDDAGERSMTSDMHYITIFGDANIKRANREIKYKAHVLIEGFIRYLDKRDPETNRITQRYTYIQAEYWQVSKEGNDDRPAEEHTSRFREGIDTAALDRIDKTRDSISERRRSEVTTSE